MNKMLPTIQPQVRAMGLSKQWVLWEKKKTFSLVLGIYPLNNISFKLQKQFFLLPSPPDSSLSKFSARDIEYV